MTTPLKARTGVTPRWVPIVDKHPVFEAGLWRTCAEATQRARELAQQRECSYSAARIYYRMIR